MVQHNAAKFISNFYPKKDNLNNFSITKLLNQLNFVTLEDRRIQAKLIMAYKILNGKVILDSEMLPKFNQRRPMRKCNTAKVGTENRLEEPHSIIKNTASTFFYLVPKLWNNWVTPSQARANSVDSFKEFFHKK